MSRSIKNLVFEGGGIKGIAYIGALAALAEHDIPLARIQRVAGTSIGALLALLIGLNFNQRDINQILWQLDIEAIQDSSWGIVRDFFRLLKNFGICQGKQIKTFIENLIERKTANKRSTFADINAMKKQQGFKDIYVVATNLSTNSCEIFSYEHTPHLVIADAVCCSLAIPFIFPAVKLKKDQKGSFILHEEGDIYVDGGIINNYPIRIFDKIKYLSHAMAGIKTEYYEKKNKTKKIDNFKENYIYNTETLGFRLEDKAKIDVFTHVSVSPYRRMIGNFKDYLIGLIDTIITAQQDYHHVNSKDNGRTVYIDSLGVKATDFKIDIKKKQQLIESGKQSVDKFFNTHNKKGIKKITIAPYEILASPSTSIQAFATHRSLLAQVLTLITGTSAMLLFYRDISLLIDEIIKSLESIK